MHNRFLINRLSEHLFSLDNGVARYRARLRLYFITIALLILSLIVVLLHIDQTNSNLQRFALIGLSFIMYSIILWGGYYFAKKISANYLGKIMGIKAENILLDFLEEVSFGDGSKAISIDEENIAEKNENPFLLMIGGPGRIQIHPGRVVILDRKNGNTEVASPRKTPWVLDSFDLIRKIGELDDAGQKYAIISLQDQLINELSITSRTKEGIPVEVHDIKILFSVLRKPGDEQFDKLAFDFDEVAMQSLIDNQIVITPSPKAAGISFPWGTTVVPLVMGELQSFINSRSMDEILGYSFGTASDVYNQNRGDDLSLPEKDMQSKHSKYQKVDTVFFNETFKEKARKIGVEIHLIDTGIWIFPSGLILDELRTTWRKVREISERRTQVEKLAKKEEVKEIIRLVHSVISPSFGPDNLDNKITSTSRKLSDKEFSELAKLIEENPEITLNPILQQNFTQTAAAKKEANDMAINILKAIRRELIAGRELIENETNSSVEKQVEIALINKALRDIDHHTFS